MNKGSDKARGGQGPGLRDPVGYAKEYAFSPCLMGRPRPRVAEGEADSTRASDTHRVLSRGTRRHREEELLPQCVGGPWEPQRWRGPVGTGLRVAGGVQWQTDVGSGAPETLWHALRSRLSAVPGSLILVW